MQHDWIPSKLGHGNQVCRRCSVTDLEAAAIGMTECDPPQRNVRQSQIDDHLYEPPDDDNEYDEDDNDWGWWLWC